MAKEFSADDVATHNKEGNAYIIIDDGVYDISKFAALHPGGKGANQAVAAARLRGGVGGVGGVSFVGCVGDDADGAAALAALRAEGVDTADVAVTADAPTGTAVVLLTPDGQNAIVVVPGANSVVDPAAVKSNCMP